MKTIKGKLVGYTIKGESGFPELTISVAHMDEDILFPLNKDVEINLGE